jgi:hypothetical protein
MLIQSLYQKFQKMLVKKFIITTSGKEYAS